MIKQLIKRIKYAFSERESWKRKMDVRGTAVPMSVSQYRKLLKTGRI